MPKIMVVECGSDNIDQLIEQIKIIGGHEHLPFKRSKKIYEFGSLRIDEFKQEVTFNGDVIALSQNEFEILGLFASHPNQLLSVDFFANVIQDQPNNECVKQKVIAEIESLSKKLCSKKANTSCKIVDQNMRENKGYRFEIMSKKL